MGIRRTLWLVNGLMAGVVGCAGSGAVAQASNIPMGYSGKPFQRSGQAIPGKIMCAYYDLGGEGVAYHDTEAKNHGSGELNPADGTYLNEFRIREGVDTSYTKFDRKPVQIDDNPFDKIVPPRDLVYVHMPLLCLRKAIRSRRSGGLETRKSISLPGIEASGSVSHLSSDCSSHTICDFFSAAEYA